MEQKKFAFMYRAHFRDEPARLDPTMTLFNGLFLKCVKLHNIDTDLKIVVLNLHQHLLINSEVIAFFAKTDFCHIYTQFCYNSRTTKYLKKSGYLT